MLFKILNSPRTPAVLLLLFAVISTLSIFAFKGTGDSGDSIHHYLFARYALIHPELYFNHWAKPVFVLLASPFAQFGFEGIKIFNALCTLLTMYLTYRCATLLRYPNSSLVIVFLMFSPLYYILTFSGLTEPLFAMFLAWALFQTLKGRYLTAAILVSFMPYVRSEGLIIEGVFLLYFLYTQRWKILPFLLSGSVLYGLAGFFVYGTPFWVFTNIPYSTLSSVYGHGDLFHLVIQLINVVGVPLYALFWIGVLLLVYDLFRKKNKPEEIFLVLGLSLCYLVAHSLFWYLGIFNSMGLKRVLIGILPTLVLLCLFAFNFINGRLTKINKGLSNLLTTLLLLYILIFPFTENPAAIHWEEDMGLSPDQELAKKALGFLEKEHYEGTLVYNYYYLSLLTNKDHFNDPGRHRIGAQAIQRMQPGDVLIWDSEFAEQESGYSADSLNKISSLKMIFHFKTHEAGRDHAMIGFVRRNSY